MDALKYRLLLGLLLLTGGAGFAGTGTDQSVPVEKARAARIKAAFLYHFARFSTWPEEAFADSETPIRLCILGKDPFGSALEQLQGKTVHNRPLEIRHLPAGASARECHVVFMGPMPAQVLATTLAQLQHRPVLTVGEGEDFLKQGGIVRLVEEKNRIQFEINVTAARRAGLQLSARLLRLARIYEEAG
ncbi:YfiR family protein [Rhodothermus marinus]|uniref:YfiR family protein n=1 Tax=Rhodothermus marinus TaxID=29549 RepID=UPI0037C582A3